MSLRVSNVSRWIHHNPLHTSCSRLRPLRRSWLPAILYASRTSEGGSRILPLIQYRHQAITLEGISYRDLPLHEAEDLPPLAEDVKQARVSDIGQLLVQPRWSLRIRRIELPVSPDFISHTGTFVLSGRQFNPKFAALFRCCCMQQSLEDLHQTFASEVSAADHIYKTTNGTDLQNWLWNIHSPFEREKDIVKLLIGSTITSAHQILGVLSTFEQLECDFEVRANCLYVTWMLHKEAILANEALLRSFDAEVDKLRLTRNWPEHAMILDHLLLLVWRSDEAQIEELITRFPKQYPRINTKTRLFLTRYCANNGMADEAFAFFSGVAKVHLQNPTELVASSCSELLKHDVVVETPNGPNFRYLPTLLEKGLVPTAQIYSRIIGRAMSSDYTTVAWDVYHYACSINVMPDWHAHLLLLRHCFNSRDIKGLDEIMVQIHQQEALYTNSHLLLYAMNMVRRINVFERDMTAKDGLSHILALYDRKYSRGLLSNFDFMPKRDDPVGATMEEPNDYVLSFTVWAYILCHKSAKPVQHLWDRIRSLAEKENTVVVRCLKLDLIYNACMFRFLHDSDTTSLALEVLQYMLEKGFCAPTSRTWSILICGLLRNKQHEQAKQIYALMLHHGFQITDIRQEYIARGVTLQDLEERKDEILDEGAMPDGSDEISMEKSAMYQPYGEDDTKNLDVKGFHIGLGVALDDEGEMVNPFFASA